MDHPELQDLVEAPLRDLELIDVLLIRDGARQRLQEGRLAPAVGRLQDGQAAAGQDKAESLDAALRVCPADHGPASALDDEIAHLESGRVTLRLPECDMGQPGAAWQVPIDDVFAGPRKSAQPGPDREGAVGERLLAHVVGRLDLDPAVALICSRRTGRRTEPLHHPGGIMTPNDKFRVAVLVATAHRSDLLARWALPSIERQTRPPWRVVVVDDSRTDAGLRRTEQVVGAWQPSGVVVDFLRNRRTRGACGAWNSGFVHLGSAATPGGSTSRYWTMTMSGSPTIWSAVRRLPRAAVSTWSPPRSCGSRRTPSRVWWYRPSRFGRKAFSWVIPASRAATWSAD